VSYLLNPQSTLITGMTGSGKTTFVVRYLMNRMRNQGKPACVFIFDNLTRMQPRLRIPMLYTAKDLDEALPTRWVCFNNSRMFPGDTRTAFRWFCFWIFDVCRSGPGEKIVCFPEVWQHCTEDSIPQEFAMLAQAGRELNIHLIVDTQQPEKLNDSIVNCRTETVAFRCQEGSDAARQMERLGFNRGEIQNLPPGTFIAKNNISGGQLKGKLF
jgi:hypothetical protein